MKKKYYVEGMTCGACVSHVESAVKKIPGVSEVSVNLMTKEMFVTSSVELDKKISSNVSKAGYKVIIPEDGTIVSKENLKKKKNTLLISVILSIVLMIVAMSHMVFGKMSDLVLIILSSIQLVIASVIIRLNFRFYASGFKKLVILKPNMDSLIAIGSSVSYAYSIYGFIMIIVNYNNGMAMDYFMNLYFDSSAMILALVSLGKYFESLSTSKTTKALEDLVNLIPTTATKVVNGELEQVDVKDLNIGDIVLVKTGSIVPIDGVIIEGSASLDESNITGESIPVYKKEDDEVISSSLVVSGVIKVEVKKLASDSTISKIVKLVDEASSSKAPIFRLADKVAGVFAFIVIGIALITFAVHMLINGVFASSFNFAVSVLVISCPCALGLATPVAIMVGTGVAAKNGFLIKNAEVLENTSLVKAVIFDKTGTITYGKPEVVEVDNDETIQIAYSLEKMSNHPFSNAITSYASILYIESADVKDYENIDGVGISGAIDGTKYYAGNMLGLMRAGLLTSELESRFNKAYNEGLNVIAVYSDKEVIGLISIKDKVKENGKELVDNLLMKGITPIMVTGDKKEIALSIASEVGINEVVYEVMPQDKGEIVDKIKEKYQGFVCFIGDGVNDAIALTKSDVAIAIGSGTDIAIESSDLVILSNDLKTIDNAINLSKKVMKIIKINLFWAFFYNVIAISMAAGVFAYSLGLTINPMIASLAMSISSLFVVTNSLRINRFNKEIRKKEIEGMNEVKLFISNMNCMHCVARITEAVNKVKGLENVKVELETKTVSFTCDKEKLVDKVIKSIEKAGYEVKR